LPAFIALWYCETVKNITVSVDDETYRRARVKAAEKDMSVSALVREFLNGLSPSRAEAAFRKRGMDDAAREFGGERRPGKRSPLADAKGADDRTKLQLMEELWASLDDAQIESPPWHKDAVEETAARFESGAEKPRDWTAAKRELRKRAE
jgi:hypothetical protein